MRRTFKMAALALGSMILLPCSGQAGEPGAIGSRYTRLDNQCRVVADGGAEEDWLAYRCEGYGGIPVWLSFSDSTKLHIGFGAKQNVEGIFNADRNKAWPAEWRGTVRRGRFEPFAVIVRVSYPGEKASFLAVYRLKPDATSCILGDAQDNRAAQAIADGALEDYHCVEEG